MYQGTLLAVLRVKISRTQPRKTREAKSQVTCERPTSVMDDDRWWAHDAWWETDLGSYLLPAPVRAVGVVWRHWRVVDSATSKTTSFLIEATRSTRSTRSTSQSRICTYIWLYLYSKSDSPPINSTINSTISIETAMPIQSGPPGHRSTPKASPHEERDDERGQFGIRMTSKLAEPGHTSTQR